MSIQEHLVELKARHRELEEEIADALERGSFDYKAQGWTNKETRVRNLAISMGKNSLVFHRLPNGFYGLVKWYPDLKKKKQRFEPASMNPDDFAEQQDEDEIVEESGEE